VRSHTDAAKEIMDVMRQVQEAIRARFHKLIMPYNLTIAQFKVLQHLHWHDREGGLGICELSEHIGLANSTTSGIVDRLERDGWVVREKSDVDHRKVKVRLREKGREFFKRIPQEVEEFWRTTIGRLSTRDRTELLKSLGKLREVMERPSGPSYEEIHEGQRKGLKAEIEARTDLQEVLSDILKEIGLLSVLARRAEEEGRFKITAYLKQIASEQVLCALSLAKILGYKDIYRNIEELKEAKEASIDVKRKIIEMMQGEESSRIKGSLGRTVETDLRHCDVLEDILNGDG